MWFSKSAEVLQVSIWSSGAEIALRFAWGSCGLLPRVCLLALWKTILPRLQKWNRGRGEVWRVFFGLSVSLFLGRLDEWNWGYPHPRPPQRGGGGFMPLKRWPTVRLPLCLKTLGSRNMFPCFQKEGDKANSRSKGVTQTPRAVIAAPHSSGILKAMVFVVCGMETRPPGC